MKQSLRLPIVKMFRFNTSSCSNLVVLHFNTSLVLQEFASGCRSLSLSQLYLFILEKVSVHCYLAVAIGPFFAQRPMLTSVNSGIENNANSSSKYAATQLA
jgi:hypothetical protein